MPVLHILLFARSLGHRFGAGAAPCGSAFRTRVPRPPGFGLLPPRRLRVPFQKLPLLATRPCRDLGAAHLCALWDVSRLTGQKGETPFLPAWDVETPSLWVTWQKTPETKLARPAALHSLSAAFPAARRRLRRPHLFQSAQLFLAQYTNIALPLQWEAQDV